MRNTILCLLLVSFSATAQQTPQNQPLAAEIDSMRNADQAPALLPDAAAAEKAFKQVIHSNFTRVKAILDTYGYPGYNLVGKTSSDNYWLLVQHSDFDVAFQKKALELMKAQVAKQNASGKSYAYLQDRINLNEGKQQVYGTQIYMTDSGYQAKPMVDAAHVDERRKVIGLSSLAEYLDQCNAAFNEYNKGRSQIINKKLVRDTTTRQ